MNKIILFLMSLEFSLGYSQFAQANTNEIYRQELEKKSFELLWGEEITKDIFNSAPKKSLYDQKINGWTLKEIEKGKIKIKNFEVDGGHLRDLPNNQFMNNRSIPRTAVRDKAMFVDDDIDIGLVPLYACQNKEEIKKLEVSFLDTDCYENQQEKFNDCIRDGNNSHNCFLAFQYPLHTENNNPCVKNKTVSYKICKSGVLLGYSDNLPIVVTPLGNYTTVVDVRNIPYDTILTKLAENYGKPDKIIKRKHHISNCNRDTLYHPKNDKITQKIAVSCNEDSEIFFWIEKPWVLKVEVSFENNQPIAIKKLFINWGNYQKAQERIRQSEQNQQNEEKNKQERKKKQQEEIIQQKINNFNI